MDNRNYSNTRRYQSSESYYYPHNNTTKLKQRMNTSYPSSNSIVEVAERYPSQNYTGGPGSNMNNKTYGNSYSKQNQSFTVNNGSYSSNNTSAHFAPTNWNKPSNRSIQRGASMYSSMHSNETMSETSRWNQPSSSLNDADWHESSRRNQSFAYRSNSSLYNQQDSLFNDYNHYSCSSHSSSVSPMWSDLSPSLYDFNDVTHSYYEVDNNTDDLSYDSNFWVNVPQQDSSVPVATSSRSFFGFSDNVYLDPMDCEGISAFNTGSGIYAPRMSPLFSPPGLPRERQSSNMASVPGISRERQTSNVSPPPKKEFFSSIPPPVHLSRLWEEPVYHAIWDSFDFATQQHLQSVSLIENVGSNDVIAKYIENGIQEKKNCHITKARSVFVQLAVEYSSNIQVWLEFTRLEMECGEYKNARVVLDAASRQHPHNELLLQKRLRVEERLRSISDVIMIINELRCMDTQKSMKIMVEGVSVLSKLGYEKMAREYGVSISADSKYFSGNLYLELMLCEQRCGSVKVLLHMVDQALVLFPKYGPLWFFCFTLLEHIRLLNWDKKHMLDLIEVDDMENDAEMARGNLTADILWKVFLYRAEYWYRSCIYLRMVIVDDPSRMEELLECEFKIAKYINKNMEECIDVCPSNLLWKMYLVIARYAVFVGYRGLARKLVQRAYRLVPVKSRHAVILDYSKIECIARHRRCSLGLLNYGILHFPTEWKLLLERIQQLTLTEQYTDALRLNIHALKTHVGAGRLWSSYIHLIHQIFGPDAAMVSFREALKHVAKSGEVWCEGARIYLNPVSKHFHLLNASKCLNYAVFFTPQYGDSFIEAIRLAVLSSDLFLACHSMPSFFHLSILLRSYTSLAFMMKRCAFYEPNYGPLWFRCQEFILSSPKEILYRSYHITVVEISVNKDLYYEAMMRRSIAHFSKKENWGKYSPVKLERYKQKYSRHPISPYRKQFSYSFKPEYMLTPLNEPQQLVRQMKLLYGTSQLDNWIVC